MSTTRIRDLTQTPRENAELVRRSMDWARICSVLDAIDDASSAIASYDEQTEHADLGGLYLLAHGLTQAFYIQQYAIRALVCCLRIDVDLKSEKAQWKPARDSRVDIGHPTEVRRGTASSTSIVQSSLTSDGYLLQRITHAGDHDIAWEPVNLTKLIGDQREAVDGALRKIVSAMEQRETEHRREHRNSRLTSAFGGTPGYFLTKFRAELTPPFPYLLAAVGWARRSIENLRKGLTERGITEATYADIESALTDLPYYLDRLEQVNCTSAQSGQEDDDPRDVVAIAGYAALRMEELLSAVRDLDRMYESDDPDA